MSLSIADGMQILPSLYYPEIQTVLLFIDDKIVMIVELHLTLAVQNIALSLFAIKIVCLLICSVLI